MLRLQWGQESSFSNLLFLRFALMGKESDPTLHNRDFTLFGVFKLQIPFHAFLAKDKSDVVRQSFDSFSMSSF